MNDYSDLFYRYVKKIKGRGSQKTGLCPLHNDTKELYDLSTDPLESKNLIGTKIEIESTLWDELIKIRNSN